MICPFIRLEIILLVPIVRCYKLHPKRGMPYLVYGRMSFKYLALLRTDNEVEFSGRMRIHNGLKYTGKHQRVTKAADRIDPKHFLMKTFWIFPVLPHWQSFLVQDL
jgi:hypothetical protein